MQVVDPAGSPWPVTYRCVPARYSYEFRAGWRALAAAWDLGAGDSVTLTRAGPDRLKLLLQVRCFPLFSLSAYMHCRHLDCNKTGDYVAKLDVGNCSRAQRSVKSDAKSDYQGKLSPPHPRDPAFIGSSRSTGTASVYCVWMFLSIFRSVTDTTIETDIAGRSWCLD